MKNLITVAQYPKSEIPERYIRLRDLKKSVYNLPTLDKPPRSAQRQALYSGIGTRQMLIAKRVPKLQQLSQNPGTARQKYDHKRKTLRKNVHQNIPA